MKFLIFPSWFRLRPVRLLALLVNLLMTDKFHSSVSTASGLSLGANFHQRPSLHQRVGMLKENLAKYSNITTSLSDSESDSGNLPKFQNILSEYDEVLQEGVAGCQFMLGICES